MSDVAIGRPLADVFHIINGRRGNRLKSGRAGQRVGQIVGLANHTVLIHRDGTGVDCR